jgi:hypothetical protein
MIVSIITALLDGDINIFDTAASIPLDMFPQIEWIVKDSRGYVDVSLASLCCSRQVKIVARPDASIYDALNQALDVATGKYFFVLGAGDKILVPALRLLYKMLEADRPGLVEQSIFFPVIMRATNTLFPSNPQLLREGMTTPHPGAVLKRENVIEIGGFDTKYRIASDYDLLCRYLKRWPVFSKIELSLVDFMGGGVSERCKEEAELETALIRRRLFQGGTSCS